jgi:hypothetical protein
MVSILSNQGLYGFFWREHMNTMPKVFVGSSSESLNIAYEIQFQLKDVALVQPWKGLIGLGSFILESLMEQIYDFDFGIFIFAADDIVEIRGENYITARDNVILETGLFIEKLGRKRTFLVVQEMQPKLHLPSDLAGLKVASFHLPPGVKPAEAQSHMQEALWTACAEIKKAIQDQQALEPPEVLSSGMVYLLGHLEDRGYSMEALTRILVYFEIQEEYENLSDREKTSWEKATQYACQCLRALDLVHHFGSDRYGITPGGRKLLKSSKLQHIFPSTLLMAKKSMLSRDI